MNLIHLVYVYAFSEGILFAIGNPLLDISAEVTEEFLERWMFGTICDMTLGKFNCNQPGCQLTWPMRVKEKAVVADVLLKL